LFAARKELDTNLDTKHTDVGNTFADGNLPRTFFPNYAMITMKDLKKPSLHHSFSYVMR
jgi:hypothetical protein